MPIDPTKPDRQAIVSKDASAGANHNGWLADEPKIGDSQKADQSESQESPNDNQDERISDKGEDAQPRWQHYIANAVVFLLLAVIGYWLLSLLRPSHDDVVAPRASVHTAVSPTAMEDPKPLPWQVEWYYCRQLAGVEWSAMTSGRVMGVEHDQRDPLVIEKDKLATKIASNAAKRHGSDYISAELATAHSLVNLSTDLSRLPAAESREEEIDAADRALDIYEKILGKWHPETITCLKVAAMARGDARKDLKTAEIMLRRAYTANLHLSGRYSTFTTGTAGLLSWLYEIEHKSKPAVLFDTASRAQHQPEEEPGGSLFFTYVPLIKGNYVHAERNYKQSIERTIEIYGADHIKVAIACDCYAAFLRAARRSVEAEQFSKRANIIFQAHPKL